MKDVISELEEQLRYAEDQDDTYAAQLKSAIELLKYYEEANTMYELSLTGMKEAFESDFAKNEAEYLVVHVVGNAKVPEIIINPRPNFQEKLDYYTEAYNEDLTLKALPSIKVQEFKFMTKEDLKAYF